VLLADGSSKPIEKMKLGDLVVATDPETGKTAAKAVTRLIAGAGDKNLVQVTIDTDGPHGHRTGTVVATDHHPFWLPQLHRWVDATDLQAGQWLQTSAGTWVQITAVTRWTEHARVHNLTIDDLHTYYVLAGDTPVLVHNCDLANYADSVRNKPGIKFASEYTSPSGAKRYGHNGHGQQAEGPLADALERAGRHGGCAEVHSLSQA
jgi:hypothetical protein